MPEFDEETYHKKNRNNDSLKYEPGKNQDRYQSKKPNSRGSKDEKSTNLWVEASTSKPEKGDRKTGGNRNKNKSRPYNKRRKGNYRNNRRRPRKLTLWEKFLKLFGIQPKKKNRRNQRGKGKGKGQNQQRNQGDRQNRDRKDQDRRGDSRKPSQKGDQKGGQRPPRKRSRRPQDGSDERAKGGEGRPEGRKRQDGPNKSRPPRRQQDRGPRQQNRERGNEPRESAPSKPVESVAAPKTTGDSIALGAIELNKPETAKKEEAQPKPTSGRGGRRNRRATNKPAAGAETGSDFVPHPIELPKASETQSDSEA